MSTSLSFRRSPPCHSDRSGGILRLKSLFFLRSFTILPCRCLWQRFLDVARNDKEKSTKNDGACQNDPTFVILSVVEGSHRSIDDSVCGVFRLRCTSLKMTRGKKCSRFFAMLRMTRKKVRRMTQGGRTPFVGSFGFVALRSR
jgi:hypothetical protein